MRFRTYLSAVALAGLLAGCGAFGTAGIADAFSYRFADNQEEDVARVFQGLPEPGNDRVDNAFERPVAVATTHPDDGEGEATVVAIDIEGGEVLWEKPIDARTRPEVLGDVVMTSVRQEVLCLDLRTGNELWRVNKEGLAYVGAARSGDNIAFVVSVGAAGGATRVGHIRMRNARTGSRVWDHEIAGVLGHPQAFGSYVFVPWDRQNIAILNASDGIETARIRTTDDIFSWVEAEPAGLFYGHQGIYRFTERSFTGTKEESTYRSPPVPDAPRDPLVHDDGFFPMPGTRSARGRIQTYWEPVPTTESDSLPVVDDRFYFVYYRYVFCFDGEQNLQWVRLLEQDVIRAHAVTKGLMTIGEQGAMHLLDMRTGNDRWSGGVDRELASAGLDIGDFDPAADHDGGAARDLRTSLIEISGDGDNRLTPARAYAVQLLGGLDDPEITRDLLDLYAQRSVPSAVREGDRHRAAAARQRRRVRRRVPEPPLRLHRAVARAPARPHRARAAPAGEPRRGAGPRRSSPRPRDASRRAAAGGSRAWWSSATRPSSRPSRTSSSATTRTAPSRARTSRRRSRSSPRASSSSAGRRAAICCAKCRPVLTRPNRSRWPSTRSSRKKRAFRRKRRSRPRSARRKRSRHSGARSFGTAPCA